MTVYSFYIFDRHTECVFTKNWLPPSQQAALPASASAAAAVAATSTSDTRPSTAVNGVPTTAPAVAPATSTATAATKTKSTRAQNDAKLIFGTVFSLRNMVRKLGGDDDAFISYRTGQYRMHYYETPTNLRFVLLTDTATMSMRNVLHQIYINLWVEYVVKNPLSPVEHKGGAGITNELFEMGLDQFIRGLQ
ncbi:putative sybindin-like family protein [Diaporthe ampelina]|uniref:Trafficking protein particle complex subunit n=1 Tax=Diaporthe ampelina TaxID=1214573 RepID=A0A0G2HBY8_9PEZI|nr:putative sybindin-like family protein [Diaporthe ampelina]